MCGIVGAIQKNNTVPVLLRGLHALEYRGYDSAGIAVLSESGLSRVRSAGKICDLESALKKEPIFGNVGIAHTRWATHGEPSERNAHPHVSRDEVAVVHNGIIENYESVRVRLETLGYVFTSDTDTEVIAHLIHFYCSKNISLRDAVRSASLELRGAYAIAVIHSREQGEIVAARRGSPLVLGIGEGEMFLASDVAALLSKTDRFVFLENGDVAVLKQDGYSVQSADGNMSERPVKKSSLSAKDIDRGGYAHFMQKEIFEQPVVIAEALGGRIRKGRVRTDAFGKGSSAVFRKVRSVQIIGCGTSYHSGMVARYWMEPLADIPCQADVASEWRYRKPRLRKNTLYVFISQSGETKDTLACLEMVKREMPKAPTLAICNVPESSMTREADLIFLTRAGAEIGVASTKAFTTQLVSLMLLTLSLGRYRKMPRETEERIVQGLLAVPSLVSETLSLDSCLRTMAVKFVGEAHTLYLGRGLQYPIALEGALKLKEISYIHAEGYQAGELKHGPLALVDKEMPVIAVAPNDSLAEKLQSNLREVKARHGKLFIFASRGADIKKEEGTEIFSLPEVQEILAPIVYIVPLQLFAYHVAVLRGNDVDQPRNLAKSVTVE